MSSPSSRRPLIWGSAAVALAAVTAGIWWTTRTPAQAAAPKAGRPPVPVSTERARSEDLPQITHGMGTVRSLHDVTVQTQVEGVLTEVRFREGQTVKRGELLARIDDRIIAAEVAQAQAEKRKNEAQLAAARIDLARYTNLAKEEAISKQAIDQQTAVVEQLEATIAANDAAVASAQARLSYTRIVSPVDGRVGLRRVDPGNVVQPNSPLGLVSVTQLDPISVVVALPQDLVPVLQGVLHDHPDAPVLALDRPAGQVLAKGRMQMIDNQIDPATGTIQLKSVFPNPAEKLWPGQSVAIELQTGLAQGAVTVAVKSVQRGMKGPFVYRVKDGKAEVVQVKVGHEHDGRVVIASGLEAGDEVVSDGHSRVVPGGPVKVGGGGATPPGGARTATTTAAATPAGGAP